MSAMNVPVCIIGCGPIGLTGALLLSRHGIKSLLIDKRGHVNTHPRSRFVDTNTMELMRELGIEKEVEQTGLPPVWTEYNRWFGALTKNLIAEIPSPTFHTVPRATSPTMPIMTCQDYVENELLKRVRNDPNIDLRFNTEAVELSQDDDQTFITISSEANGAEPSIEPNIEKVTAAYTIGADGPHSMARTVIGSELETSPAELYSQDIIFEADLSAYATGREGGLMYVASASGVFVFQPLNGITRWRCQIFKPDPDILPDDEASARIREAIGVDDVPISITSTGMWQPTPGCVSSFGKGRIYLAGDAAHVFTPTGGLGNNTGFTGIRNLAWKLAYVLKGISSPDILDSYEVEHKPHALRRIKVGVETAQYMAMIFAAYYQGEDVSPGVKLTRQYADYDGVLLGFEIKSDLIAENAEPPPPVENETIDFIPAIRLGRRAPHVWLDEAAGLSILDWFGLNYVLVLGKSVDPAGWEGAVAQLVSEKGFPIEAKRMAGTGLAPYDDLGLVLVRPDGFIADHWLATDVAAGGELSRLLRKLPIIA